MVATNDVRTRQFFFVPLLLLPPASRTSPLAFRSVRGPCTVLDAKQTRFLYSSVLGTAILHLIQSWVLHGNTLVGLLETTFITHCKSIQGVNISQGMVDQYNKRAETLGVTSKMSAMAYELKGLPEELEGRKFDVILCTMAYHHFESTDEITRILAYFLKPGGALLVTDRVSSDAVPKIEDIPEKYRAIVPHKSGFSEEDMRKVFEDAGLESFSLNVIPGLTDQKLFLKVLSHFSKERELNSSGFHCCLLSPGIWYKALHLIAAFI
ncbi:uncharacterized protein ARMOST_14048 [Armillaria ostoyae]|uniref:Methyltransferase domain-containing protein n=1 Tax=Armillaria ostoyae TaxID=47428 RepID=A0A284RPH3_ARMOS|nr:uncharacterized protein ARMOST_14048 [Armillaria ostoyae]